MFILLLPLKDFLHFISLIKFLKQLEKMTKIAKKTLKRYSFRKPIKQEGTNGQVGPISTSNSKEEK
jgi:hypothetical protein